MGMTITTISAPTTMPASAPELSVSLLDEEEEEVQVQPGQQVEPPPPEFPPGELPPPEDRQPSATLVEVKKSELAELQLSVLQANTFTPALSRELA